MMLSLMSIIFFSGERRVLALIVLGPALYLYLSLTKQGKKKWRLAFLAGALGLFWLMQAQVQFRSEGFYDFDAGVVETNPVEMHRDNNFYWFTTAVDTMPDKYNFTGEWIFSQVFVHPVPRFLWPGKPYTVGLPFVRWEDIGASLSISVTFPLSPSLRLGAWHINFGVMCCFYTPVVVFQVRVASLIDEIFGSCAPPYLLPQTPSESSED